MVDASIPLQGRFASQIESTTTVWDGLRFQIISQDITDPTEWRIEEPWHILVVHLDGRMNSLETELEGFGGSIGPATVGEVWCTPAERRGAAFAQGEIIQFAALSIKPGVCGEQSIQPLAGVGDSLLYESVERLMRLVAAKDDISVIEAETSARMLADQVIGRYGIRRTARGRRDVTHRLSASQARHLRRHIHGNLASRIALDEMAAQVDLTTHQLLLSFRGSFGTTPAQYLIDQRLRRARWLLLHSRSDIMEISLKSGFSSHSHLTYAFGRRLGCSPSEFRRRYS